MKWKRHIYLAEDDDLTVAYMAGVERGAERRLAEARDICDSLLEELYSAHAMGIPYTYSIDDEPFVSARRFIAEAIVKPHGRGPNHLDNFLAVGHNTEGANKSDKPPRDRLLAQLAAMCNDECPDGRDRSDCPHLANRCRTCKTWKPAWISCTECHAMWIAFDGWTIEEKTDGR